MKVRFKLLNDKAVMPKKAHATDAGFDLVATSRVFDKYGNVAYGTGIAVDIPEGYVGLIFPRSSICKYDLSLSNAVGVIDAGYHGEISCKFSTPFPLGRVYEIGDRIAQLVIMPIPEIEFEEVDDLGESERGEGGYGSTGR